MEAITTYSTLARAKYVRLTTFRKTGEPVHTAIWIAPDREKTSLYGFSGARTGKVKRMLRNPNARLAPCDMRGRPLGPALECTARVLPEDDAPRIDRFLDRKYPLARRLLRWYGRLRGGKGKLVYFELVLRDGLRAQLA